MPNVRTHQQFRLEIASIDDALPVSGIGSTGMKKPGEITPGRISRWWHGEFTPWDVPGVVGFHMERHWTSRAARATWDFYRMHWQWLWGILIALAGLAIAF